MLTVELEHHVENVPVPATEMKPLRELAERCSLWFVCGILLFCHIEEVIGDWRRSKQAHQRSTEHAHAHRQIICLFSTLQRMSPRSRPRRRLVVPQRHSDFLSKLPFEIRIKIYEFALSQDQIYLDPKHRRISSKEVHEHTSLSQRLKWKFQNRKIRSGGHWVQMMPSGVYKGLLSLPLTCRQLYEESIDLIYSQNVFSLNELYTTRDGIIPYSTVSILDNIDAFLPSRALESLRHLKIYWTLPSQLRSCTECQTTFSRLWTTMASMKGLRRLEVIFNSRGTRFNMQRLAERWRSLGTDWPYKEMRKLFQAHVSVWFFPNRIWRKEAGGTEIIQSELVPNYLNSLTYETIAATS